MDTSDAWATGKLRYNSIHGRISERERSCRDCNIQAADTLKLKSPGQFMQAAVSLPKKPHRRLRRKASVLASGIQASVELRH